MLRIDDVVVAIVADEVRGAICMDRQFPDLEFFGRDLLFEALRNGKCIQRLIGSAFFGDVFRAVREQNIAIVAVPVPIFRTRELP
jgi:hypothetical protein